jgi:hypothetical protein
MIRNLLWGTGPIIVTAMMLRDWWMNRALKDSSDNG